MSGLSDFEAAQAFLQTKAGESSVYDHMKEVVLKLITEQPGDALAAFEHVSAMVKASTGAGTGAPPPVGAGAAAEAAASQEQALAWAKGGLELFVPGEEEEAGEPVQNLTDDANYLEWAGVSLGRTETFRLHASLKRLAAAQPVQQLRLWGKILGLQGDYYVAECVMEGEDDLEEGAVDATGSTIERGGEGVNKHTYFVASHAGGQWTKLPNVTPQQVVIAGQIKRYFTGSLQAAVGGHPPFPGTEAAFLRAVIARISADTVIAPAGIFKASEEEETYDIEVADEEEEPFEPVDLTDAANWVHATAPINVLGRVTPNPPALDEEGEPIPDEDAPEPPTLLAAIAEDVTEPEDDDSEPSPLWAVRSCPSTGPPAGGDETTVLAAAKSLKWPGAVAVGLGKRYVNMYVGYGVAASVQRYEPMLPGAVEVDYFASQEEGKELVEAEDVKEDPDEGKVAEEEEEEEDY
ncbi:Rsph4a [Symbiodinium sp. KB8]|nr:Rsph4a [Symbiodinium sp. KB8]